MEWYDDYYQFDNKKTNNMKKINWLNLAIEIAKVIIAALAGLTAGTQLL